MIFTNELWPGGPCFKEIDGVFRIGADSVLLSHFAIAAHRKIKRAADLGCGSGIISVLLAFDSPDLHVDAVEADPTAVLLAAENVRTCGLSERITVIEGDLRMHRDFLRAGSYDLVVSNPPYFKNGSGKAASNKKLAAARGELQCTLDDICVSAGYLSRWGGSFALVHKPERLAEVFRALSAAGLEPKRLKFVQHTQSSPPSLVLIESKRGGKPSLTVETPLILKNEDGSDTEVIRAMYRRQESDL